MNISHSLLKNRYLHRGLEFASDKSPLFVAGTTLALSTLVRPASILATPKTDRENKRLACIKSLISAGLNFVVTLGLSLPLIYGIKRLEKNPGKYLRAESLERLRDGKSNLGDSKTYEFASQLFKLGLGAVIAAPKSILNARLLPKFSTGQSEDSRVQFIAPKYPISYQNTSFTGTEGITKLVGRVLDKDGVQRFATRYKDSNFPMHISAITDTVATGTFIHENNKNSSIDKQKRVVLNKNCGISTGLSIGSSYVVDSLLNKPTDRIINKFREVNKGLPHLEKCINGIKIAKPTLIMGGVYYMAIPMVSTFFAERDTTTSF